MARPILEGRAFSNLLGVHLEQVLLQVLKWHTLFTLDKREYADGVGGDRHGGVDNEVDVSLGAWVIRIASDRANKRCL